MEPELFIAVEVQETGQSEALVRQASAIERDWLPADQLKVTVDLEFDDQRERVVAMRRARFDDLVIEEAPVGVPAGGEAAEILAREAADRQSPLQWFGPETAAFVARVEFLRRHMPELDWPPLAPEQLDRVLVELCHGCVSFEDVRRKASLPLLQSSFNSRQLATLDREAPPRIRVPSGSQIAIDYAAGKTPLLAVRIQEMYGLPETPRLAGGRVQLLLHLLAPNIAPATSDRRPCKLLGEHIRTSAKGSQSPISEALLARQPGRSTGRACRRVDADEAFADRGPRGLAFRSRRL